MRTNVSRETIGLELDIWLDVPRLQLEVRTFLENAKLQRDFFTQKRSY